ncbi:unnamed protein product [Amaranthus hypochondriacus]
MVYDYTSYTSKVFAAPNICSPAHDHWSPSEVNWVKIMLMLTLLWALIEVWVWTYGNPQQQWQPSHCDSTEGPGSMAS